MRNQNGTAFAFLQPRAHAQHNQRTGTNLLACHMVPKPFLDLTLLGESQHHDETFSALNTTVETLDARGSEGASRKRDQASGLLPSYKALNTQRRALAPKMTPFSPCTVLAKSALNLQKRDERK